MHPSMPTCRWTSTSCTQSLVASLSSHRHRHKPRAVRFLPETLVRTSHLAERSPILTVTCYPHVRRIDINLSASPNVTATAQLTAHLKPTFEFGVSIAGHDTGVYLDLDAYAELDLSLTAAASGSVSSDGSNSTSTGAGGCVDISTGLSVDAGAEVDLVIFKAGDEVTLFNKSFDLYKKCFGNSYEKRDYYRAGNSRRAALSSFDAIRPAIGRRRIVPKSTEGFSCPTSLIGALSSIVSETVDATR